MPVVVDGVPGKWRAGYVVSVVEARGRWNASQRPEVGIADPAAVGIADPRAVGMADLAPARPPGQGMC